MKNADDPKNQIRKHLMLGGIVIATCLWTATTATGQKLNETNRWMIIPYLAEGIVSTQAIGIVEFKTAIREGSFVSPNGKSDPKRKVLLSKTVFSFKPFKNESMIHIEGEFRVIQQIRGRVPDFGKINKDVPITGSWGIGADPNHENLSPLVREVRGNSEADFVANYIVMGPEGTNDIAQMKFIGPVPSGEERAIKEFAEQLQGRELDDIPVTEAKAMQADENPWIKALGTVRLDPDKRPYNYKKVYTSPRL